MPLTALTADTLKDVSLDLPQPVSSSLEYPTKLFAAEPNTPWFWRFAATPEPSGASIPLKVERPTNDNGPSVEDAGSGNDAAARLDAMVLSIARLIGRRMAQEDFGKTMRTANDNAHRRKMTMTPRAHFPVGGSKHQYRHC